MSEVSATLDERQQSYGTFMDNALISDTLLITLQAFPGWKKLKSDQRVALHHIMAKIGRVLTGDPDHRDSWLDMAGYAQLVVDRIDGTGTYAVVTLDQCGGPDQLAGDCCQYCYRPVGNAHSPDCLYVKKVADTR